jgi:succinate dehydrogenase / fumarate reductase cytochrome b subunit
MSETTAVASLSRSFFARHHFALRRLHSASGIVPLGLFLVFHLLTNSTAFLGPGKFNEHVHSIHALPYLLAIETLFIFLPLAFHGVLGVVIAWQGKLNPGRYPYMDNWRYTLQRITAWVMIAFVVVHLLQFRFAHWFGRMEFRAASENPGFFAFTQDGFLHLVLPTWLWMVLYAIGLSATVFHFANGVVTFCITWGITIGVRSRQRLSVAAGAVGALLVLWGVLSLVAFGTFDLRQSRAPLHAAIGSPTAVARLASQP